MTFNITSFLCFAFRLALFVRVKNSPKLVACYCISFNLLGGGQLFDNLHTHGEEKISMYVEYTAHIVNK